MILRLFLFLITGVVYSLVLQNGFAFDDLIHVAGNPRLRSLDAVLGYFTMSAYPGDLYRPVVFLSYHINYIFGGYSPWGYHLVNLLLHQAVVLLAYELLSKILNARESFLACLIFALHPIHVEVIANVSGRAELLAAVGVLLALLLSTQQVAKTNNSKFLTAFCLVLSLLLAFFSKESSLVVLLLLPLYLTFAGKLTFKQACLSSPVITAFSLGFIYLLCRYLALGFLTSEQQPIFHDNALFYEPAYARVLSAWALLGHYALLVFAPVVQSADYSYGMLAEFIVGDNNFNALIFAVNFFLALLLLGLAVLCKKDRPLFFTISWYFLSFIVTANIFFPIGTIFAERLLYLPSLGLIALMAIILLRFLPSAFVRVFCLLLVLVMGWLSQQQIKIWKSNESLYEQMIISALASTKANANYGVLLEARGQTEEARNYFFNALEISRQNPSAAYFLGRSYLKAGQVELAEKWYQESLNLDSEFTDAHYGLAQVAIARKDFQAARKNLLQAIKLRPLGLEPQILLTRVYLDLGETKLAQELYQQLLAHDDQNPGVLKLKPQLEELGILGYGRQGGTTY